MSISAKRTDWTDSARIRCLDNEAFAEMRSGVIRWRNHDAASALVGGLVCASRSPADVADNAIANDMCTRRLDMDCPPIR